MEAIPCDDPSCYDWLVVSLEECLPDNDRECGPGTQVPRVQCVNSDGESVSSTSSVKSLLVFMSSELPTEEGARPGSSSGLFRSLSTLSLLLWRTFVIGLVYLKRDKCSCGWMWPGPRALPLPGQVDWLSLLKGACIHPDQYVERQLCRDAILPMPLICEVPCPKDCALSPWTSWSHCSHTCSGKNTEGKQMRARSILAYNAGEGKSPVPHSPGAAAGV